MKLRRKCSPGTQGWVMCSHLVSTREGFYRGGRISSALLSLDRIYRIETKGHPEVPLNLEHIEPGHNITRASSNSPWAET